MNWLIITASVSIGALQPEALTHPTKDFVPSSSPHEPIWIRTFAFEGNSYAQTGHDLVECSDGGFAIAGTIHRYDPYESDGWLIRTDENGAHLWNHTYGESDHAGFAELVECQDGGFAMVGFEYPSKMWLVRTDVNGTLLWSRSYEGDAGTAERSIVECGDGGFAISGTIHLGGGNTDIWLIRTDADGVHQWNRTYGDEYPDQGWALVDTNNGFVIVGRTHDTDLDLYLTALVRTSESGHQLWMKTLLPGSSSSAGAVDIVNCSDGGFALAGYYYDYDTYPYSDMFVIKTDATGEVTPDGWWQAYTNGNESQDRAHSIIECNNGGFLLAGRSTKNASLVRIDTDGNRLWNQRYACPIFSHSGYEFTTANSIVECADGGFAFVGDFCTSVLAEYKILLIRVPDPYIYWVEEPNDQTLQWGEDLSYTLEMFTYGEVDQWRINDTGHFSVDASGTITGNSQLDTGVYGLRVTVDDTDGNSIQGVFSVTILAASNPVDPILIAIAGVGGAIFIAAIYAYRKRKSGE